jgi:uncharacterized protein (DUF1800 family)
MPAQADVEHLLRRTEFVARPWRVGELVPLTLEQAVDNILAVPADPGAPAFASGRDWEKGEELTHFWLDRMAWDSPRPIQEKMSFFWHGHFCSEFSKVGGAELMGEQIQLFRTGALGNMRDLAITMSTQVAMIRYLDNNDNRKSSPNQNFARELMELFILGVGNYTEADVEAATAAWTGHTDDWQTDVYIWREDWHDANPKTFLGRPINTDSSAAARRSHGYETIDVMLGTGPAGSGTVPVGPNAGRTTRDVAAEFVSRKLWTFFAGTTPPAAVIEAMRASAVANNFAIAPWLRTMLLRGEFYATDVKQGLVRSPLDLTVAMLFATGLRSAENAPLWSMEGMGQRPLFPPNVSGWKHNGYFVNASAMAKRTDMARHFGWRSMRNYWEGDQLIRLGGGSLSRSEIETTYRDRPNDLVDRILSLMYLAPSASTRNALYAYAQQSRWWERHELVPLALMSPDINVA